MSDHVLSSVAPKSFSDVSPLLDQSIATHQRAVHKRDSNCPIASQDSGLDVAKRIYDMRRSREQFLPPEMFSEPAWDMLLFLYMARAEQRRTTVGAACASAGVPVSTALRWIQRLVTVGMVTKEPHPTDQRVNWLVLTANTECQLNRFFDCLRNRDWI